MTTTHEVATAATTGKLDETVNKRACYACDLYFKNI